MKYPAGISGEEYAAMEEGYEQGLVAGRAQGRSEEQAERDMLRAQMQAVVTVVEDLERTPKPTSGGDFVGAGVWSADQAAARRLRAALEAGR